jgi:hypothetical protein
LSKIWRTRPLYTTIVEFLQRKQSLIDTELFTALKKDDRDLSFRTFNKTLMKLELEGIIYVSNLKKNKRQVELVKP